MKIAIVDRNDEVIGYKNREDELGDDISRVSALWVYNSKGQSLLAQRALNKKFSPGKWGPAVAGTVEEGETYLSNIIKETKEELGVDVAEEGIEVGDKKLIQGEHLYFRQYYYAKLDLPLEAFTFPEDEVMQIRWVDSDELEKWLSEAPDDFTPSLVDSFHDFLKLLFN